MSVLHRSDGSRANGLLIADWMIYVRNASPDPHGPREVAEAITAPIKPTYAKTDQRKVQVNAW